MAIRNASLKLAYGFNLQVSGTLYLAQTTIVQVAICQCR
jgi:hypothetical protein